MPDDSPRDNISTSGHPAISIDSGRGDRGGEQSEQPSLTPAALTTLRPARGASAFTLIGRNVLRGDKTGIPHQPTPTLSLPSRPPSRAKDRHRPVHGGAAAAEAQGSGSVAKGAGGASAGPRVPVGNPQDSPAKAPVAKTVVKEEKPPCSAPALPFSPESIQSAAAILRTIFTSFSTAREERKGTAYRQLQRDLSAHADVLILSGQITLPQIIDTMQKMEEYLGTGEAEDSGQDASEVLHRWLSGEDQSDFDQKPEATQ